MSETTKHQLAKIIVRVSNGAEFDIVKTIRNNRPACWGKPSEQEILISMDEKESSTSFHDFVKSYIDDSDTVGL